MDQHEVDFILDENIAIEVKGKSRLSKDDFIGIRALKDEKLMTSYIVVCLESTPREIEGIRVLPWQHFLKDLWTGKLYP